MKAITDSERPDFWLISDPHLIADDLHNFGARFKKMRQTSAGKDIAYQDLALRAFVRKVVRAKPAALIITGDLTFNGAKRSAERLGEIFAPLKERGLPCWLFRATMTFMTAGPEVLVAMRKDGLRKFHRLTGRKFFPPAMT